MNTISNAELKNRINKIRTDCSKMFYHCGQGHYGGAFSCAEIVGTLYFRFMNVDPRNPHWEERDRFILSKGHCGPAVFSALSQLGFFPSEWLERFDDLSSPLSTHPCMHKVPGIDFSTGSLGHGLSLGVGIALAGKMDGKTYKTYVVIGDGESNEGQIWEAAMASAQFELNNLICFVDRNRLTAGGFTEEIMGVEPFADKWRSFGWDVNEIDGHDIQAITLAIQAAHISKNKMPKLILANTIKGKGVSFIENQTKWHAAHIDDSTHQSIMKELSVQGELI